MSGEILPTITITDFKLLLKDIDKLKQMKCYNVTYNGEYLFTFIMPQTSFIRNSAEYLGETSNSVGGRLFEALVTSMETSHG